MFKSSFHFIAILFVGCFFSQSVFAQPTWTIDPFGKEKKPAQYEEKILASEKTGNKKFTTFKRIIQNTVTHYNFYFNANKKLNGVLEKAKVAQKDDYTALLSFYPYSMENTSAQKTDLDSVIYKATAGLLLHDLRNDWVDNLYLLIGKSYYFRNELDSATLTFQFINYNLFPRKKKEDDNRVVGTNDLPGTGGISIANKEKRNIFKRLFSMPPSRNDALVWLARSFTTQEAYGDAAGLITILQNDKNMPKRLRKDLEEVSAYWFFQQKNYDSAANHLEKALGNADTKQDKSRWEFLLGQLLEMNGQYGKASSYYEKCSKHTVDLVMDINARLNAAKMLRDNSDPKQLDKSISNLIKMARKGRFEIFRDVVYYSAAQLAMQKADTASSILYLTQAVKYNNNNLLYKNKSFYQLGNLAFSQLRFKDAHDYYDSLQLGANEDYVDLKVLNTRKESLSKLVEHLDAIQREDSLQRIAAMTTSERDAYLKKLLRKLRREKGLAEEDPNDGSAPITMGNDKQKATDLFESNSKGEWYFYNSNLKSKGQAEFIRKWGKRTNTDNWRRKKAVVANPFNAGPGGDPSLAVTSPDAAAVAAPKELSLDLLMEDLPMTPDKLDSSNLKKATNLLGLASILQNDMEEYASAITTYEDFLKRFPENAREAEALFGIYVCYSKLGMDSAASYYKNLIGTKHSASPSAAMLLNPSLIHPNAKNPEVTSRYESIYALFIEGRFADAVQEKKKADSLYGSNYWTPQLLYIEAMYLIKERKDSLAILELKQLIQLYPESELRQKAATLIDVLGRRKEIEEYLTKLEVTRIEEDKLVVAEKKPAQINLPTAVVAEPVIKVPAVIRPISGRDSSAVKPVSENAGFTIQPELKHMVVMLLKKVDAVYINEAKNAFARFNKERSSTSSLVINRDVLDQDRAMLLFSSFDDAQAALAYMDNLKKIAPSEVSWLQANKYSFMIISENNLQALKANKNLDGYLQLLKSTFGNKF
jgi:tetratricopeptide (TPR) repeat protein